MTEAVVIPPESLDEFWRSVYPDGITIQKVNDELHDFRVLIENIPTIYMHITGGQVSKHLTDASVIMALHDDYVQKLIDEAIADDREERSVLPT